MLLHQWVVCSHSQQLKSHTHTHARMHARTHTCTHTKTGNQTRMMILFPSFLSLKLNTKVHPKPGGDFFLTLLTFLLSLSLFLLLLFHFNTSFLFSMKFCFPYLSKATTATRTALLIPNSVHSISVCPNNGMAASVWDF